ncbi:hypothetical protein Xcel_1944 [Xylanimonas cellulosilytica DSM 15894]|uniref:Uncharacterized protein n=1 Tax=Xylanimonas cellulosilytica (strain DSM 15894 / JCM 12276 / CECT 5975 / KCTC 9989 / LMG 20990 / NBRC 107835 / XIL07) TaxID=446471 RepID=D1BTI4_XYLCX|nr:hypothetical protein [Xylanimonas cellulosilytica]ACZ30963.1 hypothetical protein Xcel_1944 [Xylanimonas cellulosilytica DSM 15894]
MSTLRVRHHTQRRRLVGGARGPTPAESSRWFRAGLEPYEPTGDGVWLIRRLEVRTVVPSSESASAGGRRLAAAVARAVDDVVAAGPNPPDVLWFPDRAAYLAQWVLDLVRGCADGRWEYHGLTGGSPSGALHDVATAEPSVLLAALLSCGHSQLDEVVERIDPVDAAAIAHALATGSGAMDVRELAGVVRGLGEAGRLPAEVRQATLAVVLALARGDAVSPTAAACARDLVVVAGALAGRPALERAALARALAEGDWRTAAWAGASEAVAALVPWDPGNRRAAVAELAPREPAVNPDPGTEHASRFGGIYLLLPLLAELPLREATRGWPPLGAVLPDRIVAAVAIACVIGHARAGAVLADPGLQLALGLDGTGDDELAAWADGVTVAQRAALRAAFEPVLARRAPAIDADLADPGLLPTRLVGTRFASTARVAGAALLRELSFRLPGMAAAGADHLRRNVLAFEATVRVGDDDEPVVVLLGHPPLGLLLNLTGMDRCRFRLEATGEREWVLTRRG